ncbi:ABC transporter permease [Bacteroidales bacterium]|nr:ABC transporter permease [Bacteroidales bacterium]
MNLALFIAKRIYLSKEGDDEVSPATIKIAVLSMALGLAVMILAIAIVVGFKQEVRNKVIGFGSHIQITNFDSNTSYETQAIAVDDDFKKIILQTPGVRHLSLFATKPGIIKTENDFQGIILKGVDHDFDWQFFRQNLIEGDLINIESDKTSSDVVISKDLSDKLQLKLHDSFSCYFVQEDVRARKYNIVGIYETNFSEYDKLFILTDIKQIRRLNKWDEDQVSGVEILVDNYDKLDEIAENIYFQTSSLHDRNENSYYTRSIKQINPMIFEWLDFLDTNVVIILTLMLAVSGFTMISGLLIIILGRTNMIGILKALGYNNTNLRKVFLYLSFFLISKGLFWGNVIGLGICLVQKQFGLLKLDPSIYYLDKVPVEINLWTILLLNIGTLLVAMLMLIGPSYLITKISPAKSIRFD